MNVSGFIARRYLFSKKSNNAINIISFISIAGIAVGTAALVIILSAFNGISDLVKSLYNSFDPDIEITIKQGKTFDPNATELDDLRKLPGVLFFSYTLQENVLLKYKEKQCLATLKGVDTSFLDMTRFDTLLLDRAKYTLNDTGIASAIVGKGLAYRLDLSAYDFFSPLTFYVPKKGIFSTSQVEESFNEKSAYPTALFSINDDFDFKYVLTSLPFAQRLLGYQNQVSSIELGLDKQENQGYLQKKIAQLIGEKYTVKNRAQQNELLFKTLQSEKLWTFIILVFILIIATFNVIGSLSMLIIEKKKDINTLWNIGANKKTIRTIFLTEGMLITLIGGGIGLLIGVSVCLLQQHGGFISFSEGYIVESYPIKMRWDDFLFISIAVFTIGFLASWYPIQLFVKKHLPY